MARNRSEFVSNIPQLKDLSDKQAADILNDIATAAEALAKGNVIQNDTIDTGFMLNAIYAIHVDSDGKPGEKTTMTDSAGQTVERESVDGPSTEKDTSAIACGANYAIYIELDHPFLGPASDQVKSDVDSIIATHRFKQ